MEQQKTRIFLIIAIALVGMMLHSKWQMEFGPKPAPAVASSSAAKDIPIIDEEGSANNSAVPNILESKPKQIPSSRIVKVKTDVLDIEIDTLGGDLVKLELPGYPQSVETPEEAFKLLDTSNERMYIAQSGLTGAMGPDSKERGRATYKSSLSDYQLGDKDKLIVPLTWNSDSGLNITKSFIFTRGSYAVDVVYNIKNNSDKDWTGRFYGQLKRQKPVGKRGILRMQTYTGAAVYTPEKPFKKVSFDKILKQNLDLSVQGGWAAMVEHYFVSAWIPGANQINNYFTSFDNNNNYQIGTYGPKVTVSANTEDSVSAKLYVGPEISENLKPLAPGLDLTVNYGWLWPISLAILWVLKHIYSLVGNWGAAIILVTVLIKIMFYKLSATSYRSMANMRKIQPKVAQLRERHGDDRQKMSQAMMELYKKEKINPLGGCLPILVQIPVFIALYYVLLESVELRQSPFIFWIQDLSVKDPFFVLPLLMGATMLLQQRLNPAPPDPMQAKVMMAMPIVFTILFLQFPAGLVLYWFVNNGLSVIQQWYIMRSFERAKVKK